jgi:hypothetical protein
MASTSVQSVLLILSAVSTVCHGGSVIRERDAVPAGYAAKPYYPTPHGGWTSDWSASYNKAKALVQQMTLAEKTNITAGTGIYMGKFYDFIVRTIEPQLTGHRVSNGPQDMFPRLMADTEYGPGLVLAIPGVLTDLASLNYVLRTRLWEWHQQTTLLPFPPELRRAPHGTSLSCTSAQ